VFAEIVISSPWTAPALLITSFPLASTLALTPAPKWGLSVGVGSQESRYYAPDTLLQVKRYDRYESADATISYAVNKNLSFRTELLWSNNISNISLYKYDRSVAAFKVRYEFK
jgi:hypothetical protein